MSCVLRVDVTKTPDGAPMARGFVNAPPRRRGVVSTPPDTDGTGRRWEICCHEAAHVVGAGHLLGHWPVAAVVQGECGLTFARLAPGPTGVTRSVAVMAACGWAGEALAAEYSPPAEAPKRCGGC